MTTRRKAPERTGPASIPAASAGARAPAQFVFGTTNLKRYEFPTHINDLVVDRAAASCSEVFVVVVHPGKAPPWHKHDDTEQIFFVMEGKGTLTIGADKRRFPVVPGDIVRVPVATFHSIRAEGSADLKYLCVDCFGGGRAPDEPTWEDHVKALCRGQGWDYATVVGSHRPGGAACK
jgi:mannose-6-phosphate isomerase-like protein (cupin superfamily)